MVSLVFNYWCIEPQLINKGHWLNVSNLSPTLPCNKHSTISLYAPSPISTIKLETPSLPSHFLMTFIFSHKIPRLVMTCVILGLQTRGGGERDWLDDDQCHVRLSRRPLPHLHHLHHLPLHHGPQVQAALAQSELLHWWQGRRVWCPAAGWYQCLYHVRS